jgi:hypothetical protein
MFRMRREEAALTSGELTWVGNNNPDAIVSFVRKRGEDEVLVLVNLTNRPANVQVDVPAPNYAGARDLLKNQPLPASLAAEKYSCRLGAFDYMVAKRAIPAR